MLSSNALAPSVARATDATEDLPRFDSSSFDPRAEFAMDPVWNRNRSDVTAFAAQVYYCPMSFPLLQMTNRQLGDFVTPQPTREGALGRVCL